MTVHSGESFYVHPEANVSVFSDLNNSGSLGSYSNSSINFLGQRWNNMSGSQILDESTGGQSGLGGTIRFSGTAFSQFINTTTTGQANTGFPNITLANPQNLILQGNDLVVRRSFNFQSGRVILNSKNAIMQAGASLSGFDNSKYFVTGTATTGGALIRKTTGSQSSQIIFPVGTTVGSYTPASVIYSGIAQDLKLRVFDNVYDKATFGNPDNVNFVTKTWNISFNNLDPRANLVLRTQHNLSEEGSQFSSDRTKSFVSRYQPNIEKWDFTDGSGISPGIISSGNPIPNSFISLRTISGGMGLNEYFSKSVLKANVLANYRVPVGISPNNDGLNDKFVIENLKANDKVRIDIYNRWQSLVFRDTDYKNTFEGIGNQQGMVNNSLPDGTYYYILHFNDSKPVTGYIIINR
ncbi:gliding motility-associated C-terminal domain-containing protein [Daejeonella sp.]|uniref:gliding motility-associated C-terminal domain-containing protein n=1 Tax=Daejeonella sp. TaxID=2805397 RepID=UPI002B718996|nr:gliding motility-associated C-terminal domain-containing protein [Daejeonella sp.]HQT23431.1 gliding motility-associated C-terminal domain-containing protein [Daejeonella sp.]HQT57900.1 gliding motility-associated C-terminal domain-containing protein [Daejeonella sp.]